LIARLAGGEASFQQLDGMRGRDRCRARRALSTTCCCEARAFMRQENSFSPRQLTLAALLPTHAIRLPAPLTVTVGKLAIVEATSTAKALVNALGLTHEPKNQNEVFLQMPLPDLSKPWCLPPSTQAPTAYSRRSRNVERRAPAAQDLRADVDNGIALALDLCSNGLAQLSVLGPIPVRQ
ncbi:MAG: hypothetical protein OEM00_11010, partial [Burkholderiaceae bacterium]|nr:hypothetical protein [Burkholderiaceae bacterium]